MAQYDIFISYRRDGGEQTAKLIYDKLFVMGYKPFLDVETLRSGSFNTKLYEVIEGCKDVVVVLSPGALDRCVNDDDWVRLEIAHALEQGKNVIPILLRGFSFPDSVPNDIDALRYKNGIPASVEFFDAFIEKLSEFLESNLVTTKRIIKYLKSRIIIMIAIVSCMLILAIWGVSRINGNNVIKGNVYPNTQEEQNEVNQLIYQIETNLSILDNILYTMDNLITECDDYLINPQQSTYNQLISSFDFAEESIEQQFELSKSLSTEIIEDLNDTVINIADLQALYDSPQIMTEEYINYINAFRYIINPENMLDISEKRRIINIYGEMNNLEGDMLLLGVCDILLPVDEKTLEAFQLDYLPNLYVISQNLNLWSRDETNLNSQMESKRSRYEKLINEYTAIVGNLNMTLNYEEDVLIRYLMSLGMTKEEAAKYIDELIAQEEIAQTEEKIEATKERIKVKFAPKEGDDPYLVWAKALRFLSVDMYEEAVNAFQFHMLQLKDEDANALIYVPNVINLINNISETGVDYGLVVVGYEPDKAPHSIYNIGDILIAINDVPVRNIEDHHRQIDSLNETESYIGSILRFNENGKVIIEDIEIKRNEPLVAYLSLEEEE